MLFGIMSVAILWVIPNRDRIYKKERKRRKLDRNKKYKGN